MSREIPKIPENSLLEENGPLASPISQSEFLVESHMKQMLHETPMTKELAGSFIIIQILQHSCFTLLFVGKY